MKNNKLISLVLALLVCFSLVLTASATSDNKNLTLAVEATPSTLVYGNTIKVSVMANENPGFLCVNFQIMWDTSVLEFVSADTTGSSFTMVEANHQEKFNKVVITVGDPYIALNMPQLATKFTETGKIVDLTFKVKEGANADTKAKVYFTNPSFVDLNSVSNETLATKDLTVNVLSTTHVHKSEKPATCTEPEVCAQCGTQMAPPVAHKSNKPATCTEPEVCAQCGTQMAPAAGHKPGAAATCIANQTCTVCSVELAPVAGHKPGAAATCTTAQTCTVCKAELAAALGHKPGAAATCTSAQTCTVCKAQLAAALGHKPGAAATCTTAQTCTVCNSQIAPAKGHSIVTLPSKAPNCTEAGLTAGSQCSVCSLILTAQNVVPANGHKMGSWVDTDANKHWHQCSVCGAKADEAAHTLSNGVCSTCGYGCKHSGGTATCTAKATCTICGMAYGEMKAHTPGAAATCTSEQKCTVCQTVLAGKLAHNTDKVEAKAATCGAIGWEAYEKCKNCDYTTYKEIAATGAHTFGEWEVVQKATLKATGEKAHTCSVCELVETEVIPVQEFPVLLVVLIVLVVAAAVVIVIIVVKKKKK